MTPEERKIGRYDDLRAMATAYLQDPNTFVLDEDLKVILDFISYCESAKLNLKEKES